MGDDPAFLSALEQAALVRRRELAPRELVELYLERIDRLDPELRTYVTVCGEQALAGAESIVPGSDTRPFLGVPIAVKDLTETAGVRTTFSSRAFADYVPEADSAVARRLREAGFVLLGKTNTPEFGARPVTESVLNGDCRNPWDATRTPGGSSGGSAAALAAGLCPIATGSDGGGSIRIPASCCGLVGLKPSRGRVSNAPRAGAVLEGFATSGPLARTVADAAALLDVLAGYESGDPYWAPPPGRPLAQEVGAPPGKLRVALTTVPPFEAEVDPVCAAAAAEAGTLLAELGHEVEEAAPPWADPDFRSLFTIVWQGGSGFVRRAEPELFEPLNRALAEAAAKVSSLDYVAAVARLQALARGVVSFFERYDLLLTPTIALEPVPIGWTFAGHDPWDEFERGWRFCPFTQWANITGQPAVSLPLHGSESGLPVGVQLVGAPAGEATLVRVAAQLEEARPWAGRRPANAAGA
jgi:amidase